MSIAVYDPKEPVEFGLSQSTTHKQIYNIDRIFIQYHLGWHFLPACKNWPYNSDHDLMSASNLSYIDKWIGRQKLLAASYHYPKNIDGNITHCAVCQGIGDQRFSWNHRLSFHSDLINGRFSFLSNSATVPLRHTRPAEMKWVLKFPAGHFMIPIHISHRGFEARRDRTTQGIWLWSFGNWSLKPWLLFWVWAFHLPMGSEYPWSKIKAQTAYNEDWCLPSLFLASNWNLLKIVHSTSDSTTNLSGIILVSAP